MKKNPLLSILFFVLIILGSVSCTASSQSTKDSITPENVVTLYGEVTAKSANIVIARLHDLYAIPTKQPIYFFIDSGGGSVFAGTKIIDTMLASPRPIYTIDVGIAASMAAFIHSYGVKRYMLPHAILMFHNASITYNSDIVRIESELIMLKSIMVDLNNNVCDRSKVKIEELQARESQEWWILSYEAKQRGFIDDIITVTNYPVPIEK